MAEAEGWSFEQKLDGVRMLIVSRDGKVTAVGRRNVLTADPRILQAVEQLGMDCVLDGEYVKGKLWLFDAPQIAALVRTQTQLVERRAALEVLCTTMSQWTDKIGFLPSVSDEAGKIRFIKWCETNGTEGIVVKKDDSPYLAGRRSLHWLKAKFVKTCEAFILETGVDGKRNAAVGMFENGQVIPIGTVTMTEARLAVAKRGDVLEIRYLYASEDRRLVQPHVLRFREDKTMDDCTVDQLKFTNKSIIHERQSP